MSRKLEVALVVLALVALPIVVGSIGAGGRPSPATMSAFASFAPLVSESGYTATHCEWTRGHATASCSLEGGGSCSFAVSSHTGSCTSKSGANDSFIIWAESP